MSLEAEPIPLLPEPEWRERQARHRERVVQWTGPHRERARRQEKHPVCDFLFTYYPYRPGQLESWHPGYGVGLEGGGEWLGEGGHPAYRPVPGGVAAALEGINPSRHAGLHWILDLLGTTAARPPAFGCFGLHEWAMVYRAPEARHSVPLRFSSAEIADIVESQVIRCTHYDAFRFFTPEARPLNRHQPDRVSAPAFEQRGCLHVNMDLYKWAFKLSPFLPSELVADCFELAWEVREIDMRASPYDLRGLGYEPIPVETAAGRLEYERHQRSFSERGVPLREAVRRAYERVCHALSGLQSVGHW